MTFRRTITKLRSRRPFFDTLEDRTVPAGFWNPMGPGAITGGRVEGMTTQNNPVVGAINVVLPQPNNPDVLYVGGVNGGVWKTWNATSASPLWMPLNGFTQSQSIGEMAFDPMDSTYQTILVGNGRSSNYGLDGAYRSGLIRSTDGGFSWTSLSNSITNDTNINGIAARAGSMIITAKGGASAMNGVYRTTDMGATLTKIPFSSGLPQVAAFDLVEDPSDPQRLWVATTSGVFRTVDFGLSWNNVTPPQSLIGATTNNIEMAVHSSPLGSALYVAIINNGRLSSLSRSGNFGQTWQAMSLPETVETTLNPISDASDTGPIVITSVGHGLRTNDRTLISGVIGNNAANGTWTITKIDADSFSLNGSTGNGIYAGGGDWQAVVGLQPNEIAGDIGAVHFSMAADPMNAYVVYVGGTHQSKNNGSSTPTGTGWPNAIGATKTTGRLFRGDAVIPLPANQWTPLTHDFADIDGPGPALGTAPHAWSRDMAFDAAGNLIEGDDGGVYKREMPMSMNGTWSSLNGNLAVTEVHSVGYDTLNNVFIAGAQDTGVSTQDGPFSQNWTALSAGNGGMTGASVDSFNNVSYRYHSGTNFSNFTRRTYDSANNLLGTTTIGLDVDPTAAYSSLLSTDTPQYINPWALNNQDPSRMLIATNDFVYESFDQGDNLAKINAATPANFVRSLAYGGFGNPELAIFGGNTAATELVVRTLPGGSFDLRTSFPGFYTKDVAVDPMIWSTFTVLDYNQRVYRTTDAGASNWTDITGNLLSFQGDTRTIVAIPGYVLVGKQSGVFVMKDTNPGVWTNLLGGLSTVPVNEIGYDAADDMLYIGTLGRGVWTYPNATINLADFTAPIATITQVTTPTSLPVHSFSINFSEPVTSVDLADFTFTNSGSTVSLNNGTYYAPTTNNGGFTWTLKGRYPMATNVGNYTLQLTPQAGSPVVDALGNPCAPSAIMSFSIVSDTPRINGLSTTTPAGIYLPGDTIDVILNYPESMNVFGSPTIEMATGQFATFAYFSPQFSGQVRFQFTTGYGMSTSDLDVVSSSAINLYGGAIHSAVSGKMADTTLPAPGTPYSLSAATGIVIRPRATVNRHTPNGVASMPTSSVDIVFDQPMNPATFSLPTGLASFTGPSGSLMSSLQYHTWVDPFTLRIHFTQQTQVGDYSLVLKSSIQSVSGNNPLDQDCDNNPGEVIHDRYTASWNYRPLVVSDPSDVVDGKYGYGELSLREALQFANADPISADTISFDPVVFYMTPLITLTGGALSIAGPVTIDGFGYVTIDANYGSRVAVVDAPGFTNTNVTLNKLHFTKGYYAGDGAGVFNQDEALTMNDCTVSLSLATRGGGVFVSDSVGTVDLTRSTISGNSASMDAGGVGARFAPSVITINDSTIVGNSSGGSGGGIDAPGLLYISGSTISGNIAKRGGGIYSIAALSASGPAVFIRNTTIANNSASIEGGGIVFRSTANVVLRNSTLAYNVSAKGGGLHTHNFAKIETESTIFGNNSATTGPDISGTIYSAYKSLVSNTAGATNSTAPTWTSNKINVDPQFATTSPASNGGPTQTVAIQLSSPAINAGSNPDGVPYDQRGTGYARTIGLDTDIGAYERNIAPPTISTVVFGDGTNQRSLVKRMVINFSEPVTCTGGFVNAITVSRTGTGGTTGTVNLTANPASGTTNSVTITFSGSLTEFGSLVDGLYNVTVGAALISAPGGLLDGNNDQIPGGNYTVTGTTANKFFRYYGDSDGDGALTQDPDFIAFRNGFGSPSTIFDFDNDGAVDQDDFIKFRNNFGGAP